MQFDFYNIPPLISRRRPTTTLLALLSLYEESNSDIHNRRVENDSVTLYEVIPTNIFDSSSTTSFLSSLRQAINILTSDSNIEDIATMENRFKELISTYHHKKQKNNFVVLH